MLVADRGVVALPLQGGVVFGVVALPFAAAALQFLLPSPFPVVVAAAADVRA